MNQAICNLVAKWLSSLYLEPNDYADMSLNPPRVSFSLLQIFSINLTNTAYLNLPTLCTWCRYGINYGWSYVFLYLGLPHIWSIGTDNYMKQFYDDIIYCSMDLKVASFNHLAMGHYGVRKCT